MVFLETEHLVLRQFTEDDVENLVELDSDPAVMKFINGGRPTPREEIETEVLPAFLGYYERFEGYGFWAAVEKSTASSSAGSTFALRRAPRPARSSSVTGCARRLGERAMPRKAHAP